MELCCGLRGLRRKCRWLGATAVLLLPLFTILSHNHVQDELEEAGSRELGVLSSRPLGRLLEYEQDLVAEGVVRAGLRGRVRIG